MDVTKLFGSPLAPDIFRCQSIHIQVVHSDKTVNNIGTPSSLIDNSTILLQVFVQNYILLAFQVDVLADVMSIMSS